MQCPPGSSLLRQHYSHGRPACPLRQSCQGWRWTAAVHQCLTAGACLVAVHGGQGEGHAHIELHCSGARAAIGVGHSAGDCHCGSRVSRVGRHSFCDGGHRRADSDGGRARSTRRCRGACCRVEAASTESPQACCVHCGIKCISLPAVSFTEHGDTRAGHGTSASPLIRCMCISLCDCVVSMHSRGRHSVGAGSAWRRDDLAIGGAIDREGVGHRAAAACRNNLRQDPSA